jgi:fructosamine-3-kinase
MSLPASVRVGVEATLAERSGAPASIRALAALGGGCINPSARVETDRGEVLFLKWNPAADPAMFVAEADGLRALRTAAASQALRVPQVLGWGGWGTREDPGWLLLEFVPAAPPGSDYGRRLGEGLAALHSSAASGLAFGWHRDNFIGSLPQPNAPVDDWTAFWRERRLEPQLRRARDAGYLAGADARVLGELMQRLDVVMEGADARGPALLHGDLWSGNHYAGPHGQPVLIDPAVYWGVGEVDLAMLELFGGVRRGFWEAYGALRPLAPAYDAFRRDLYQLYYLLVHLNLFGGGYLQGSLGAARRALRGA